MAKLAHKTTNVSAIPLKNARRIPAAEFKTKCLSMIDEVSATGQEIIITKRGKPKAKLVSLDGKRESLMGSLEGIIEIIGDPDDLIEPVFPLEDYDMLK